MSPLWRDEVAIYLARHKVVLVRRARGLRQRVVASTELAVSPGAGGDIGPLMERLADALTEPRWQDANAQVVIADPFWSRYAIVPWPATRLDAAGRLTHARYVLADSYGDAVADWAVTLSDTPPGQSYVACAMPATIRSALDDALAPARLKLISLQPKLIVAFNAWRHRLPTDDAWFASMDEESLSAVHLRNGGWDRVHLARLSSDFRVELQRLEAFGRLTRAAGAPRPMFVEAPAWMRPGAPTSAGIEWLHEGDDAAEPHEVSLLRRMHA